MFGLGSLIGGALKIGGSIFGGISASKAMKKIENNLKQQQAENQQWYDRRYNEDATQRADAQRVLTMNMDAIRNRNKAAAGTQAVMGGTEESVASTKAANALGLADTASQIAVAGANRKDSIESQYMNRKATIDQQMNSMLANKAGNITNAINGVAGAAADIVGDSDLNKIRLFGK